MKIKTIILENFRQFYGIQTIKFSDDSAANVTVIHGENGSGKTALLNAFKWAFYGTTDFGAASDNMICERTLAEANDGEDLKMCVIVRFNHEDREYEACRTEYFKKQSALNCIKIGESVFELSWTGADGAFKKSPNASTHMNQILPSRMHPYFFFNGERIEKLSSVESSPDIQKAIKGMMGIEIIERASRHLTQYVIKDFKKDLKSLSTDELKDVMENESFYSDRLQETNEKIDLCKNERRHYVSNILDINTRLKEIAPISDMQKEREGLESDIIIINDNINSVKKESLQYISRYGFLSVSNKLIVDSQNILDEKRSKGELPSKIKEQFLNDLLDRKICICMRSLVPGTEEHLHVKEFKKKSVSSDVENAFITTSSAILAMKSTRSSLFDSLNSFRKRIKDYENDKIKKHGRIDEITHHIGNSEVEDAVALENKGQEMRDKLSEVDRSIGKWESQLVDNQALLSEWSKKRKELDKKGNEAECANERLELAEEIKRVIDELHKSLSETVRVELSSIVNETFRSIMKKEYWAEIDSDYSLQIKKMVGDHIQNVVGKSTGESQVSSLSFIGGLVSLAKKRHGCVFC